MKKFITAVVAVCFILATITACGGNKTSAEIETNKETVSVKEENRAEDIQGETPNSTELTRESEVTSESVEEEPLGDPDLVKEMQAIFDAALDYVVLGEELDAASMVSNAIIKTTSYQILSVENMMCEMNVRYPNAAEALVEAFARIPENATEKEMEQVLIELAEKIENESVEMVEKRFIIQIEEHGDMKNIVWSYDVYDAFTGGFYTIELDE